ncbi:acyl-CoA/acyl-ACP dehydrogenase [Streptomyces sp. Je 1-79]|uniref:acyl-CoA dehydrogenase family protein n=1 Tax=Streptomyces sp. Je 1-79 TaxID=2943847 RepID=UPI0021A2CCAF|nr:acyl-CoA dehydrogenase family protein [Streptomyces sp. Je 1-79]MCT4355166.1 acyl-CoA/acyl-ACP dehydrogenase [Streptomyces sp. Je 1-79]
MRPTREQDELRASVRSVLARHEGGAAWEPLTRQIGVAAPSVPMAYGGLGCGLPDVGVVAEELGRALSSVPYLGSAVLPVTALLASGDWDACARLLPGLAEGTRTGALAWAEDGGWDAGAITTRAEPRRPAADEDVLSGRKEFVLAGPGRPDVCLVFARDDRGRLGLYELKHREGTFTPVPTLDRTRPLARLVLDRAPARLLAADGEGVLARVRDVAATVLAAEQVGGAERALEDTGRYVGGRVQFGRPVGSFQAVKHRLADLYTAVESARSLALAAAHADAEPLAAAAAAVCSETYETVAGEMIQLHGGIGVTWEHPAHEHLKRAHGSARLLGPPAAHRSRIATALGLAVDAG